MKNSNKIALSFLILLVSFQIKAAELNVDVDLSPAGDFVAKTSSVKGKAFLKKSGGKELLAAKGIVIDLRTIKTGVSLRDKHLKKYLEVDKYPTATLIKAKGGNGKGIALIKVKGKKIKVKGDYEINGSELTANFPVKLSQLGITGVRYMGVGVKDELKVHVTVPVAPMAEMRKPASQGK